MTNLFCLSCFDSCSLSLASGTVLTDSLLLFKKLSQPLLVATEQMGRKHPLFAPNRELILALQIRKWRLKDVKELFQGSMAFI